ncbi:MAG: MoxR family ATPase [Candidatus Sumerlaeia bacterium]
MGEQQHKALKRIQQNIEQIIRGKTEVVQKAIICMIANGHLLIEDVPGVGKTTLAHLLARSINCSFHRIQFTSDLLPSDILGVTIYNREKNEFEFRPGPIFANIVLADEINRTTPKTQSSLLEAMNTAQVSIDKVTYDLPHPFMVIATQNPVEYHGTFPLPRSQLDRFMMRLQIGYPDVREEIQVLREQKATGDLSMVQPVVSGDDIVAMQKDVQNVKVDDDLLDYIARIAAASRRHQSIELGVSTRGALALRRAAQGKAYFEGRDYVIPDDIKELCGPVLAHRIQVTRAFEANGFTHQEEEIVIQRLLEEVEVPL